MRREYKGFYIERTYDEYIPYRIYHVVSGALCGDGRTIAECKERINEIHTDASEYARCAGVEVKHLVPKRGRWVTSRLLIPILLLAVSACTSAPRHSFTYEGNTYEETYANSARYRRTE